MDPSPLQARAPRSAAASPAAGRGGEPWGSASFMGITQEASWEGDRKVSAALDSGTVPERTAQHGRAPPAGRDGSLGPIATPLVHPRLQALQHASASLFPRWDAGFGPCMLLGEQGCFNFLRGGEGGGEGWNYPGAHACWPHALPCCAHFSLLDSGSEPAQKRHSCPGRSTPRSYGLLSRFPPPQTLRPNSTRSRSLPTPKRSAAARLPYSLVKGGAVLTSHLTRQLAGAADELVAKGELVDWLSRELEALQRDRLVVSQAFQELSSGLQRQLADGQTR